MIDINPNGKKLILTIDGGGMRGMITIAMLAELERLTGKACHELFDMVAGTSTGAIIAAGIAVQIPAEEILQRVYRDKLPKAFPNQDVLFWIRYLLNGLRNLYEIEPFVEALQPFVEGKKIRDLQKPIFFATTLDVRSSSTLYIVSKGPGLDRVADYPVSGAVAASGAAPVYFPPVANDLIDGGVGLYGNPCFAATVEAMEYLGADEGFTNNNVIVMSLGTGYTPNRIAEGKAANFNIINWIQYIIGEQLDEAGLSQAYITRAVYGSPVDFPRIDFRRYNPLLTRERVESQLGIETTGRPDPNQLGLASYQPPEVALMEEIGRKYGSLIDWTKPNLNPWDTQGGHDDPSKAERLPIDWSKTPYR